RPGRRPLRRRSRRQQCRGRRRKTPRQGSRGTRCGPPVRRCGPGGTGGREECPLWPEGSPQGAITPPGYRKRGRAARPKRPKEPDPRVAVAVRAQIRLLATATSAALASAPGPVAAQAFTPPKGLGAVTVFWQYVDNTGHRFSDGYFFAAGQSVTTSAAAELE